MFAGRILRPQSKTSMVACPVAAQSVRRRESSGARVVNPSDETGVDHVRRESGRPMNFTRIPVSSNRSAAGETSGLLMGAANSLAEREAKGVAEAVMRFEEPVHAPEIQRGGRAQVRRTPSVTGRSTNGGGMPASSGVHDVLRSAGSSLEKSVRNFFEPRLGTDFSQVRVYTDARAAASARSMAARAYTVGSKIVFNQGMYAPGTLPGQHLLAHELTHVLQQRQGGPSIRCAPLSPEELRKRLTEIDERAAKPVSMSPEETADLAKERSILMEQLSQATPEPGSPPTTWQTIKSMGSVTGAVVSYEYYSAFGPYGPPKVLDFRHFTEVGPARLGFLASFGVPIKPPTDPADLTEWERGQNIADALQIGALAAEGMEPPMPPPTPALATGGAAPTGELSLPAVTPIVPASALDATSIREESKAPPATGVTGIGGGTPQKGESKEDESFAEIDKELQGVKPGSGNLKGTARRKFRSPKPFKPTGKLEIKTSSGGAVRESAGASTRGSNYQSASAQTRRSMNTAIHADVGEVEAYKEALKEKGEIGLQRPEGANAAGTDFITAVDEPAGTKIIVTDVKTSTTGRFPKPKGPALKRTWRAEVDAAVGPKRLKLGDSALEARIRQAAADGKITVRQVNVDYSPTGRGSISGL